MTTTYTVSTFTFTVVHSDDLPINSLEHAIRESFDGLAVGAETSSTKLVGQTRDEVRPMLIELGNDGEFFDLDDYDA